MSENEFDAEVRERNFKRNIVPIIKDVQNNPRAKKIVREEGVYVGSAWWHNVLLSIFIIALIVFFTSIPVLIYYGYTQSNINQTINVEPAKVTVPVENNYEFKTPVDNKYENNYSIYVNNFIECDCP